MAKSKKQIVVKVQPKKAKKNKQSVSAIGQALRVLGGLGGGAAGAFLGHGDLGRQAGTSLGAALSRWLGTGDYTVNSNSIVRTLRSSDSIPMMHLNNQSVVIRHKEFVGEIRGSTNFQISQSFVLNPGMSASFPWLSAVANSFQEYRIKGMVYHYVPSSGSIASANPALGTVMIQTSYRSTDTTPPNKMEMLNEYNASESVPSESFCHPVECDPKENPFNVQYVRSRDVPAGDNRLLYDLGVTHVAVAGQQTSGNVLGDLWVTYEVELKKPLVSSNVTSDQVFWSSEGAYVGALTIGGAGQDIYLSNVTGYPIVRGTANVSLTGRTMNFPIGIRGKFMLVGHYYASGTFTHTTPFSSIVATNCAAFLPSNSTQLGNLRTIVDADDIIVKFFIDFDLTTTGGVPNYLSAPAIQFNLTDIPFTTGIVWQWQMSRIG